MARNLLGLAQAWRAPPKTNAETGMKEASTHRRRAKPPPDTNDHPQLLIWETTQACDAVCKQRRGCTGPKHHPDELTTREGTSLLTAVAAMGTPEVLLCGGDPAMRHDLTTLISHASGIGLAVTLAAAATPMMNPKRLRELKAAGLSRISVAIDGFNAETHDARCGHDGAFAETLRVLGDADAAGLTTLIETTVRAENERHLRTMSYLVGELGASGWTLHFEPDCPLTPERAEDLWGMLASLADAEEYAVDTLGAPQLTRVRMQRGRPNRRAPTVIDARGVVQGARARNDGSGLMFVSHLGDLSPSPWLALSAGNVRSDDVADVYRSHALFVGLRDADALEGKCGLCEYRVVCGGSRARGWRASGSPRGADPLCAYEPVHR